MLKPNYISQKINDKPLAVSVYRHPNEFPDDVLQLFAEAELTSFEFGVAWYRNLINTVYPNHTGVHFYVLKKKNKPVAVLPLRVTKVIFGQQIESLSNYYTSIYELLITERILVSELVPLIQIIKETYVSINSFRLMSMDPESYQYQLLFGALKATGFIPFKFFCFGNWYQQVKDDWLTYLKNREGSVRSTIKRATKKFVTAGGTLELIHESADLARGLAAYAQVYALSWKKPEPFPEFIPGLIRTCADKGWLRLGVAWLNGTPIAAQLWIVANGKASIYKLAYDENFKTYASGTLLTTMLMEHVMEKDKVLEIDYLIGDDPYKAAWMSQRRERWGIIAYNPKTIYGFWNLCKELIGRLIMPIWQRWRSGSTS